MRDVYQQDKERILGIKRGAEIADRVQQDLAIKAAIEIEREQRAEQQRQAEARQAEAAAIASAEGQAVEIFASLKGLYSQREEAARLAIESLAALWSVEQQIRAGENDAKRPLLNVAMLIEQTEQPSWWEGLRARAGLPIQHIYMPDAKPTSEGQAVGVTTVRGLTAGVIQPGVIGADRGKVYL